MNAVISERTAVEATQIAVTMPKESRPPVAWFRISRVTRPTTLAASCGNAVCACPTSQSKKSVSPMEPSRASRKMANGKSASSARKASAAA